MRKLFCLIFGHPLPKLESNQAKRCPMCGRLVFGEATEKQSRDDNYGVSPLTSALDMFFAQQKINEYLEEKEKWQNAKADRIKL